MWKTMWKNCLIPIDLLRWVSEVEKKSLFDPSMVPIATSVIQRYATFFFGPSPHF